MGREKRARLGRTPGGTGGEPPPPPQLPPFLSSLAAAAAGPCRGGGGPCYQRRQGVFSRPWMRCGMAGAAGAPMAVSSARGSRGGGPGRRCCSSAPGASSAGAGGRRLRGWWRIEIWRRSDLIFGLRRRPSRRRAVWVVSAEVGVGCS
jgi:hypothetical protein